MELATFEGWASGECMTARRVRLSRAIADERDRRLLLEQEVAALRTRLAAIGKSVGHLVDRGSSARPWLGAQPCRRSR